MKNIKLKIKNKIIAFIFISGIAFSSHVIADEFRASLEPLEKALRFSEDQNDLYSIR